VVSGFLGAGIIGKKEEGYQDPCMEPAAPAERFVI
jgi:hypothetical protein